MSGRDRICTIVAHNYVAQARVLAASVAQWTPESPFSTLLIDGTQQDRELGGIGEVILPEDLGLDPGVVAEMRLIYDVMEYATALKPALLMFLLRRQTSTATYLDPDIRVFGSLQPVFDAAATSGLALTPHTLEPIPRDGRLLDEAVVMHAGIYNLGFVSAGGSALRFLAWWHDRLRRDAIVDIHNALFTDQRWMDWAPSFARPAILQDKGFNAAYWNLHERPVGGDAEHGWTVGGVPLRFFHFSGYDPASPILLSKHQGPSPRNLLSEQPALRALCDSYGAELVASGHVELRRREYRHNTLPSGVRLSSVIRRLCRDALTGTDQSLSAPPDPWTDEDAFLDWLFLPELGTSAARFSRFERGVWDSRPDLRAAFPDPLLANGRAFRDWLDATTELPAVRADGRPLEPRTRPVAPAPLRRHRLGGWSVLGYANAELGVGEAGRRVSSAIGRSGVPWEMVGLREGPASRQRHRYRGSLTDLPGYDNQILCVNADQTPRVAQSLGRRPVGGRRIGYWFWELQDFPARLHAAFDHLDEVWVSGEFNRAAVAACTDKPVRIVPVPTHESRPRAHFTRRQLGLPQDVTLFLVNFDYLSVLERKNPLGAIEAYKRAFGPDDGAALVVKSINGHLRLIDRERVRLAIAGRPDIILREDYLTSAEVQSLNVLVDCVVSLHRSEGYGLNLLDAMASGTPVIATAYSGNMQFMDDESAYLVPFELVPVGPGNDPYDAAARWAEPDVEVATRHLRSIVDDPAGVARRTAAAQRRCEELRPSRLGPQLREILVPGLADGPLSRGCACAS